MWKHFNLVLKGAKIIMELIYTYIKNYRTFENQQISFSNKFSVIYDQENIMLSISENKNYLALLPF